MSTPKKHRYSGPEPSIQKKILGQVYQRLFNSEKYGLLNELFSGDIQAQIG